MWMDDKHVGTARRRWFVQGFALFLVLSAGVWGCKKKRKMRCRFPAEALKTLRQQGDDPMLTDTQRDSQVRSTFKHCTGWQPALKSMIQLQTNMELGRIAKVSRIAQAELERRLERLCPGIKKRLKHSGGASAQDRGAQVAQPCRIEHLKVMSRREFMIDAFANLYALVAYQDLRKAGLDHRAARALARTFMGRGHLRSAARGGELLPCRSHSRTKAVEATHLVLAASKIWIDNQAVVDVKYGRVPAKSKRDGPQGVFIGPIFRELTKLAKQAHKNVQSNRRLSAEHLLVWVHKNTPWRLAAEVLYTAHRAARKHFQLVVRNQSIWERAIPCEVVSSTEAPSGEPRLRMTPQTYTLELGGTSPPKVFAATRDKRAVSLKALASFLHQRQSVLKRSGRWGVIHLEVGDTLRFDRVVAVLDALRLKPGSKPESCQFSFDNMSGAPTLPAVSKSGCLLPYPKLHVGPPPPKGGAP